MSKANQVRQELKKQPPSLHHEGSPSKQELRDGFAKMLRLEWITIFYQIIAAAIVFFIAGNSQAMRTEWMENALAIVPPLGVLLTYRCENRRPDNKRPFGYHRYSTIAFVAASFALASIGTLLFYEAASNLLHGERPNVGGFTVFGHTVWHGWVMITAMIVTAIPPVILGRAKIPIAKLLHDKALYADADMNRANWLSNGAGAIGLMLMAFGFWWGDSLAALIISVDIMHDGWTNVMHSLSDVMDHHPVDLETEQQLPIIADVHKALKSLPFVSAQRVLVREHGRYFYAEIFLSPNEKMPPVLDATQQVRDKVLPLDWRLQHIVVEWTRDTNQSAAVLTREELDIETLQK